MTVRKESTIVELQPKKGVYNMSTSKLTKKASASSTFISAKAKDTKLKSSKVSTEYDNLVAEYRRLAKRADQRLVRLEAYSHDEGFKTAKQWAYARAQKDIAHWGGGKRFNTAPPKSKAQLKAKISDIKQFLESETSTKKGIINVYKRKADTINKRYGTHFTWENLATYYKSGLAEKMNNSFGSKTALKVIGTMQKNDKDVIKAIKEHSEKNLQLSDNKIINTKINDFLGENGLDISKLL
jgi:hypothetical protein